MANPQDVQCIFKLTAMKLKFAFAISLLLLLAATFAVAEDVADTASAPAPEVGASAETGTAEVNDMGTDEEEAGDDDEEDAAEGEDGDAETDEYEDDDTTEEDVESWFHDMDANKDEFVDLQEYKAFFLKSSDEAPYNISESELLDTFKLLDPAGTGKVNMAQWKLFYIQPEQEPEFVDGQHGPFTEAQKAEYRKHFDEADKDKDGFLNLQEFQSLTAEEDADAREDDHIKALFAEVDSNKDGKIDFNEYLGQDAASVAAAQEEETPASAA